MTLTVGFDPRPPVDAATLARWQADLETVVPRTDRVPWLQIAWQPGISYEPVGRWMLYEMVPNLEWVPEGIVEALQGPNPRTVGVWHSAPEIPQHLGGKRWISDSLVSSLQWQLYHETGCYPMCWWVIQGEHGGHKLAWGPIERQMWEHAGKAMVELPNPGDLPYAPYDERVKAQVVRADRMRQWRGSLAWDERSKTKPGAAQHVATYREGLKREYNKTMLAWLDEQVKGAVSEVSQKALAALDDAPPGDPQEAEKMERLEHEILTGA